MITIDKTCIAFNEVSVRIGTMTATNTMLVFVVIVCILFFFTIHGRFIFFITLHYHFLIKSIATHGRKPKERSWKIRNRCKLTSYFGIQKNVDNYPVLFFNYKKKKNTNHYTITIIVDFS